MSSMTRVSVSAHKTEQSHSTIQIQGHIPPFTSKKKPSAISLLLYSFIAVRISYVLLI